MKISILLPYKENYSSDYAGAVSVFVNSVTKLSKYNGSVIFPNENKFFKQISKDYK